VPSADKRQRKKENARQAREAREAQVKKRRRFVMLRSAAIAIVVFVAVILVITLVTHKDKKKAAATNTGITCTTTKPPSSPKNTKQSPPPMKIVQTKTYTATVSTSCGDFTVALDAKNAPKGVNNFVTLARQGFYDGLTWHRVVKDFVIQGGDPLGTGEGTPGYDNLVTELPKAGYPLGTLAYAKTSSAPAGAAGSQFFVVTANHPASLEQKQGGKYQYGAFGHVTQGMNVVQKLGSFAPASGDGPPTQPLYIDKITITEK